MTPEPDANPGPPQAHPMRRFLNFWFAAADPTVLGFMRVVTGCLLVYTHCAYTPDLANFFGEHSWYDLQTTRRERIEMPSVAPGLEWDHPLYPQRGCQVPDPPRRKVAALDFLHKLVGPDADVGATPAKVAYLKRYLAADEAIRKKQLPPGAITAEGIDYLSKLAPSERDRADQLAVLGDESLRQGKTASRLPPLPVPEAPTLAKNSSPEERKKLALEAEAFHRALPDSEPRRSFVLEWLFQFDHAQRVAVVDWVDRLCKLPPAERQAEWDYLAYWNVDRSMVTSEGTPTFSLWFHLTDPTLMRVAHWAIIGLFVLFTLGVSTRLVSVLSWLAALSYLHRSMQILFGMDTMMNIALFYLMIGDCGAALSIDRLVKRYRAARQSLAKHGKIDEATRLYLAAPPASVSAGFALRLLQVHFCFIYLASGLAKLKGNAWWNANAYWDTLANPEFTPIFYKTYEDSLRQLISSRVVYGVMCAVGVGYTFVSELGVPFLVWTRLRPVAVVIATFLHAGIAAFMGLVVFSLFMLTLLLCYIPGAALRSVLFGKPTPKERVRVHYSTASAGQRRAAALVATFDLDGRVDLIAGPDAASLVAETPAGFVGGDKLPALLTASVPTLKFFRWALMIPAVGRAFTGASAVTPRPLAKSAAR